MLKKRILASSLASVMALSSVSVVAFADETATVGATESVNKAELKEYVASFDSFLKADIYEYGTTQADQFQNAIDYAENVIADSDATDEDATAAYQMLKAVYDSLEVHTAEELQELIDDYKDIVDSENILNEDLDDNIYEQGSYDDFVAAYSTAESYVNSEDGRLITDAYIDLEQAKKDLEVLDSITKGEFRAVLRDFEAIATKFSSYENWRRGKVSVNPETGVNWTSGTKKKLSDAYYVTFDQLIEIVYGDSQVELYKNSDHEILNTTATKTWINTNGSTVRDYVEDEYETFDAIQSSNKTTDVDIVGAYKAAKEAVAVFASWKADDTTRAAKANVNSLINNYRAKIVDDYCSAMRTLVNTAYGESGAALDAYVANSESWKTKKEITVVLDKETDLFVLNGGAIMKPGDAAFDETKHKEKKIAKDQDIMKYIPILSSEVKTDTGISGAIAYVAAEADWNAANAAYQTSLATLRTAKAAYDAALANKPADYTSGTSVTISAIAKIVGTGNDFEAVTGVEKGGSSVTDSANATAYNNAAVALEDAYKAVATTTTGTHDVAATKYAAIPGTQPSATAYWGAELYYMLAIVEQYNIADKTQDISATTNVDERAAAFLAAYTSTTTPSVYVGLDVYDENDIVAVPAGSRNEYTLINRKLTYVLNDLYPEKKVDKYTKKDVANLIEKAYSLCDDTGDSEVFALYHMDVVNARKDAIDWLTAANATKGYKEGNKVNGLTATDAYNALNDEIKDLEKMYNAYPMSYGEIAELIADVAVAIDDDVYGAGTAKVKEALAKVAVGLSTLEAKQAENQPFTYDREFVSYNRLLEGETAGVYEGAKYKPNDAEKALKANIDALNAAIEEAGKEPETPEVVKGDLTGDGVATPEDAIMIVKAFVGEITLSDAQKAAADFNGDGVVNADDALAVVKAYVGL